MHCIENTFSDELHELYSSFSFLETEEAELRSAYIRGYEPCLHPYIEDIEEERDEDEEETY